MPRRSRGWRTWRVSSCIRIRCAPRISIIPTSCASISIRCPASSGGRCGTSRASFAQRWPTSAWSDGRRRRARAAFTSTFASTSAGRSSRSAARRWRWRAKSNGGRRRMATSKWWKEERHGVFIDYNQNAKDRTVASAFSVRPRPDARVSAPLTWDEIDACDPGRFHDEHDAGAVRSRLAIAMPRSIGIRVRWTRCWSCRRGMKRKGLGDAPWPPQYKKMPGEPTRVQPSRAAAAKRQRASPEQAQAARQGGGAEASADRNGPCDEEGRGARAARDVERAVTRKSSALLEPADVLVDAMRGRSSTWTRMRVNLQHVPEALAAARRRSCRRFRIPGGSAPSEGDG